MVANVNDELELNPTQLGTLELGNVWVPYIDLVDADFLPSRVRLGKDEYAFQSSILVKGHGAVLPGRIGDLRAAGKEPLIVERGDRYYVFVTPP